MSTDNIDDKFDKAERVWDRLQKLILKVLGGIVGISLAFYVGCDQIMDKRGEVVTEPKIEIVNESPNEVIIEERVERIQQSQEVQQEVQQEYKATKEQHTQTKEAEYTIVDEAWAIDPYGYRKGDTVYIDYYSDGYVERYYPDGETYYEE